MAQTLTSVQYRAAVSEAMQRTFGISWHEASGDQEPLDRAQAGGQSPQEFVDWWGEKYDLEPVAGPFTGW
jgi:hypothetical protein